MKIAVAVRCLNEIEHIDRFMRGYDFADEIVVSDGGSTDGSRELLAIYPKVKLLKFDFGEIINGVFWNTDAPHMNFVLDAAKALEPDWLIFDDMDCHPNELLRNEARRILGECDSVQINAFRLYLWGEDKYFPEMSRNFDSNYRSLWAWRPKEIDIRADPDVRHGTMIGLSEDPCGVRIPFCLLHRSWHPDSNTLGLPMNHPLEFAGEPEDLPEWARE
jgi:glycosyltransferase involved in cell wall biosynthesis